MRRISLERWSTSSCPKSERKWTRGKDKKSRGKGIMERREAFGSVESVKAASDIYAPVSGTVTEVNEVWKDKDTMETHAFVEIK